MFRIDLMSIVRSLYTVFTATGIYHIASCLFLHILLHNFAALVFYSFSLVFLYCYVCFACWALTNLTNNSCCEYRIKTPDDGN